MKKRKKSNKKSTRGNMVYNARTNSYTPKQQPKSHSAHTHTKINAWRNEPGVDEPLRVGRAIRTRDEFFAGQNGKTIHPELSKDELYRRAVVLDMDDDENLAVVKTHSIKSALYPPIPDDPQRRKYELNLQTQSGGNNEQEMEPIHLQTGKFELAPAQDNVTETQASQILEAVTRNSPKNRNRLKVFRANKNRKQDN